MAIFKKKVSDEQQRLNNAAHIKPKTIGTSNEISMSVLHAARENGEDPSTSFSQNLNSSFESEVKEKKAKRRRNRYLITFIAFLVAAVVVLSVAFAIHMYMSRINGFVASYDSAIEYLSRTDEALNLVNAVLENSETEATTKSISNALSSIEDSEVALERSQIAQEEVQEKALLPSEKEKAYRLSCSISGRQAVFSNGKQILEQLNSAISALGLLDEVNANKNNAATEEARAAELVANPTTENLSAALSAVQEAQTYINSATDKLSEAKEQYPDADFSNYEQFLLYKREALQHEANAISAVQSEDTESARISQTNYESAENQAKKYSEKIALSGNPVLEVYEKKVEDTVEAYEQARSEVASADEYLRRNM